jgi:hypothetical protein
MESLSNATPLPKLPWNCPNPVISNPWEVGQSLAKLKDAALVMKFQRAFGRAIGFGNPLTRNFRQTAIAISLAILFVAGPASLPVAANAQERITNRVAEFSGLDKITGRIHSFDVYIDETVQFGALQVTPRACYSRPATETPKTDAFIEVDEITLDAKIRRIFTGWMFADSPGLNAIEHPVYDIWLKDCKMESDVPPPK